LGKKSLGATRIKKKTAKVVLATLLIGGLVWLVQTRKEALIAEALLLFQEALKRQFGLNVTVGDVSGNFLGEVRIRNLRIDDPGLPGHKPVLMAREILLHYRWLDFLSKRFESKIRVEARDVFYHWQPHVGLGDGRFSFFGWMKRWAVSQSRHLEFDVSNLTLTAGFTKFRLEGVHAHFADNRISAEIPIRHLEVATSDLSTVIRIDAQYQPGWLNWPDVLSGRLYTEGTVVNWKPGPQESSFDFEFGNDQFRIYSSDCLGGMTFTGLIDFEDDYALDVRLEGEKYNLDGLKSFFSVSTSLGSADFDIRFFGSLFGPRVDAHSRVYSSGSGENFQALDVHVSGPFPTLRLDGSRILTREGTVMRLADTTLEASDLFKFSTYEKLVRAAEQDNVVWGVWEFRRQSEVDDRPEFLMLRSLGDHARVLFREYRGEDSIETPDARKREVGFEYRLQSSDSLKVQLRDEERIVGVEHKMKF